MVRDIAPHIPDGVHLVPAHPVAGTEHSGPEAGFATLFEGRWCVITPTEDADRRVDKVAAGGGQPAGCGIHGSRSPRPGDATSHLLHLIAYTIVGTATDLENPL